MAKCRYCFDSDILIDLKNNYPPDFVSGLWDVTLPELIAEGRLIAPIEVKYELEIGSDMLVDWVKKNKQMFVDVDDEQQINMMQILSEFPSIAKHNDEPPHADPWLIALAMRENRLYRDGTEKLPCVVVSCEQLKGNRIRIPFVCQHFQLECIGRFDFFQCENIKVVLKGG